MPIPASLKAMHRPSQMEAVRETLFAIRERMPEAALRTTFIVGYPGEDDLAFENLVRFTREVPIRSHGRFHLLLRERCPRRTFR